MSANPPSITNETLAQVLAGSAPVGVLAKLGRKRQPVYGESLARARAESMVLIDDEGDSTYIDTDTFVRVDRHGYRSGYGASHQGLYRLSLVHRNSDVRAFFTVRTPDGFAVMDDFGNLVAVQ